MKILQLVTKRQYRGAEVFAANLSSELINFGHEIIFAGLYKNETDILEVDNALNIDLVDKKKGAFDFNLVKKIAELIKEEKPDVVQCNGSDTLKYTVAASYLSRKVPIIYRNISVISEWVNSDLKKKVYKTLFKHVDHVSSVGTESIKDLITTFDYPESKTSVIRRGIPLKSVKRSEGTKLHRELGIERTDKIVIHIGNFSPEKNHKFLLEVFSKLKETHPYIKLVCVGNGATYKEVKEELVQRGLEATVYLLGFRRDIPELLACSEFFVLSSLVEGVPGVILEAATQRKPSIATKVGGVEEVLIDGNTGYIIDNFNQDEFKNKIIELAKSPDLVKELGENAYNLVREQFNPVKNARKFESLYKSLSGNILPKTKGVVSSSEKTYRVLQLIQKKQFRGAEVFCSQLSEHLLDLGNEVEIYSIYNGDAKLPFRKKINSFKRPKNNRFLDLNGWKQLYKVIRDYKPDIIQANASDTLKYAVFSKLFYKWDVPVIYRNASTSSFYINNDFSKKINSFLLKNVELIISVSEASKRDLNFLFPFTKAKSIVIPVGVEFNSDKTLGSEQYFPEDQFNIVHVGSFTREKNHLGLIRIFLEIRKRNSKAHLYLLGAGSLKPKVIQKVKELNIGNYVHFRKEMLDPSAFLKAADVLVLPSIVEGLPGVILEAMSCSVPVVAYDVGGISEVLNHATGILVQREDEMTFANEVLSVLERPNKEKIENAEKMVKDNYLNKNIALQFIEAYKWVCK